MNVNYAQGLAFLLVLACAAHTCCGKSKKQKKNDIAKYLKATSYYGYGGNGQDRVLSNVATIIQTCVDDKTMNNRDFKKKLDYLYGTSTQEKISRAIFANSPRVDKIKTLYEEDKRILKIMNSDNYRRMKENSIGSIY